MNAQAPPALDSVTQYGALGLLALVVAAVCSIGVYVAKAHVTQLARIVDAVNQIPDKIHVALAVSVANQVTNKQGVIDAIEKASEELLDEMRAAEQRRKSPLPPQR